MRNPSILSSDSSMRNFRVFCLFILVAFYGITQNHTVKKKVKEIIYSHTSTLARSQQLILVFNEKRENSEATLYFLEKKKSKWKIKYGPIKAFIGRNGFAEVNQKKEGDGKTPTGLFQLGQSFGYDAKPITKLPYIQVNSEDKWIDDPESPDYNKYIRGETKAKSFEKLLLDYDAYKFCTVIEYNTNPIVKGKGSAIFFHLSDKPTAGCVAISEEKMKKILSRLDRDKNPCIFMGNIEVLKGL